MTVDCIECPRIKLYPMLIVVDPVQGPFNDRCSLIKEHICDICISL